MNAIARVWSDKQLAIFHEIATGHENILVKAVPGSGKSTTIVESMSHVPRGRQIIAMAFNKSAMAELKQKVPAGVIASTFHSHGLKACSRAFNRPEVDGDKGRTISREIATEAMTGWGRKRVEVLVNESYNDRDRAPSANERIQIRELVDKEIREWADSVVKCVSLSKSYLADTVAQIEDVIDLHQICPPELEIDRPMFVAQVQASLRKCAEVTSVVDFDDMVWFPHVHRLAVQQFDEVFVDECQDLNAAQISLVLKTVRKGGRITAVGDPCQAIYGFTGAGADSINQIHKALDAKVLPLSITYRCSKAVVREAQTISMEIEAAPNAVEGSVVAANMERLMNEVREGDFILSRTNGPLMGICLGLLKAGRRANIQGRDIGTKLAAVMKKAKTNDVDAMLEHVDAWTALEVKRLTKREKDTTVVTDTQACIHALSEGETRVDAVIAKIDRLFADGDGTARITLSTTHKAKGLERENVWLLRDTYMRRPSKEDEAGKDDGQERNLYYVAVTRAMVNLYMVREPKKDQRTAG